MRIAFAELHNLDVDKVAILQVHIQHSKHQTNSYVTLQFCLTAAHTQIRCFNNILGISYQALLKFKNKVCLNIFLHSFEYEF